MRFNRPEGQLQGFPGGFSAYPAGGLAAFPAPSVIDTFTGTNGDPLPTYSANWTNVLGPGGLTIQSNQCASTGTGSDYWNAATFGPDLDIAISVPTVPAGSDEDIILIFRLTNPGTWNTDGDGYAVNYYTADVGIYALRVDDGVFSVIGDIYSQALSNGDSFGGRMVGDTIDVYYKAGAGAWSHVDTETDSTYTAAGSMAIYSSSDANTRLDNLICGTI